MAKKHQKRLSLIDDREGSTERTVIYQVAEGLPTGWEQFCIICGTRRRRQHLFLKTPKSRLYPILVHLWRSAGIRRCARVKWLTDSETRDANGGVDLYRMSKFALDVEIFMFTVCVYVCDCQNRDLQDVILANFTRITITLQPGNIFPIGK